jgi:hypothetical protein
MEVEMAKNAKVSKMEESDDGFDDLYGSAWLSPDDIKKPFRTVIESWERQTFSTPGGGEKDKYVLTLKDARKPCVLNKTNALNLAGTFGKLPNQWVGKPVLVKVEMTSYAGKPVKGVRMYPVDLDDMKGDDVPY